MSAITLALPTVTRPAAAGQLSFYTGAIDTRGRLGARAPMRELNWTPGTVIGFRLVGAVLLAAPTIIGCKIDAQGFLRVPAALRQRCRLRSGDHVLLAILDGRGVLQIHLPASVEAMLRGQQVSYG